MPGLNAALGGGVPLGGPGTVRRGMPAQPATLAQTAYGGGASVQQGKGGLELWHLGAAAPIAAGLYLAFTWWTLPRR